MSEEINRHRRSLLGAAAMTIAGVDVAVSGLRMPNRDR